MTRQRAAPSPAERQRIVPVVFWDIERIIAAFGGLSPMLRAHSEFGFPHLSSDTVRSWMHRRSVPGKRVAEIFVTLAKRDPAIALTEFITIEQGVVRVRR